MKKIFAIVAIFIFSLAYSQKNKTEVYKNGHSVITAMHKAYDGGSKWYKNFTFSQETHFLKDGKEEKMEIWHEAATFPGKLLIKFNTKDSKNGILFSDNKVYSFSEAKEPVSKPMVHALILAGFDVYYYKPEVSARIFDSLGYDLKKVREDVFEGRKVIVIGADKDDTLSNQVWIDSERLYLSRIIYKQGTATRDVTFTGYEKIKNSWVAKTILFKQNGKINMIEKYFDIKFPETIDPNTFVPEKFNELKLE